MISAIQTTPLIKAFKYSENLSSEYLHKLLDENANKLNYYDNYPKMNRHLVNTSYSITGTNKCKADIIYGINDINTRLNTPYNIPDPDEHNTAIMYALKNFGTCPNYDSTILLRMLDMNCNLTHSNSFGQTALVYAFMHYGKTSNCDSNVLLKILDMNCIPKKGGYMAGSELMHALVHYGLNPNCDSRVLLKLLDMNCKPRYSNVWGFTPLKGAFKYYGTNPNCDPRVFLKLILLLDPETSKSELITLLNTNTEDQILKNKILGLYNYGVRRTIINNRISKRVKLGKRDSMHLF
jgi:hypothetical protein